MQENERRLRETEVVESVKNFANLVVYSVLNVNI